MKSKRQMQTNYSSDAKLAAYFTARKHCLKLPRGLRNWAFRNCLAEEQIDPSKRKSKKRKGSKAAQESIDQASIPGPVHTPAKQPSKTGI